MSTGQKVSIPPINSRNGLSQMASQINEALGSLARAMNKKSTTQILYDTDHATARVLLGKNPKNREYLVVISKATVDVIEALDKTRVNEDDFIFHSGIINAQLERNKKLFELTTESLKIVRDIFTQISSMEGMEGIDTGLLDDKIKEIEQLEDKNLDPKPSE